MIFKEKQIENIYENKKKKQIEKPVIIADIHEKNSLVLAELYSDKDITLAINNLKIGDYLIGDTIIERKTISDFIGSMINKRLIQQLNQMQKYKQKILILEGNLKQINEFKNPNAIRGMILCIINNHCPMIFTQDSQESAKYLITLAKQQLKKPQEISLHSRIPKTKDEQKRYILESFPNIGPKTAEKLLKKFKTISNVINAQESELKELLGTKYDLFKELTNK